MSISIKEIARLRRQKNRLLKVLKLAERHLEYCNYGDEWERDCAIAAGLPEKIERAIRNSEKTT